MTDTAQKLVSIKEKTAKIVRYDGQLPNELKEHMAEEGISNPDKRQAVFEVTGLGTVLCESSDGEHWKAIAILVKDDSEVEVEPGN